MPTGNIMRIVDVASIELDRSKPFNHRVIFRDETGHALEIVKVKETTAWEEFQIIYKAWCEHPDFNGVNK